MQASEIEALGTICVLAALADGTMSDGEREHVKAAFEGMGDGAEARALASAYRRAILARTTVESEARALTTPEARRYAFEMAVAVCDADGHHSERERRFLDGLRAALGLDEASSAATIAEADQLADIGLASPGGTPAPSPASNLPVVATAATAGAAVASAPTAGAAADPSAEVDRSILRYAILNAALELLPQGLASMAIIPLQMKMVYGIGKSYGVSLDRGHIKEFIATIGVGMTSQVVEGYARDLLGGIAKKLLGKQAGKLVGVTTGAAMTFATTYALGQVAKQYYAGGRRLSSVDLRAIFSREVDRAKGLYAQYRPQVEEQARTVEPRQVLSMVRGA